MDHRESVAPVEALRQVILPGDTAAIDEVDVSEVTIFGQGSPGHCLWFCPNPQRRRCPVLHRPHLGLGLRKHPRHNCRRTHRSRRRLLRFLDMPTLQQGKVQGEEV